MHSKHILHTAIALAFIGGCEGNDGVRDDGGPAINRDSGMESADATVDAGPFVPPRCADDPAGPLPSTAPALSPGVWTNIAPVDSFYANAIVFDPCNVATLYTV